MEAILKFNLDEYEDRKQHLRCVKSTDMYLAIYDIMKIKRYYEKNVELNDEQVQLLENIFEKIFGILEEHNISLSDLE